MLSAQKRTAKKLKHNPQREALSMGIAQKVKTKDGLRLNVIVRFGE
jgi:hypothetical protein